MLIIAINLILICIHRARDGTAVDRLLCGRLVELPAFSLEVARAPQVAPA